MKLFKRRYLGIVAVTTFACWNNAFAQSAADDANKSNHPLNLATHAIFKTTSRKVCEQQWQKKGADMISKLRWLTEAMVLQQSVAYGDFSAELVEKVLYDNTSRSLKTDPKNLDPLRAAALRAMRSNPVLARNVVLLAMRHAIADKLGGPERAEAYLYRQSYYSVALLNFSSSQSCLGNPNALIALSDLFPNWQFQYRVESNNKKSNDQFKGCPADLPRPR